MTLHRTLHAAAATAIGILSPLLLPVSASALAGEMPYADGMPNDTLREVVVTATGTQHLLRDVPVQTEVITRSQLEAFGGRSIEDILSGLTSSFAFSQGDMGSQMQLGGLGNSYILILIDGKRIHGDVGGENDLGVIDPHNIERIEIVKGAQSALYGSDAMAGVINIITKKRTDKGFFAENTTRYGMHNDLRQHNSVILSSGKFASQTNFQMQRSDGWQNTSEEFAEGMVLTDSKKKTSNAFRNWQIAERLTYKPSGRTELYAEGSYYKKNICRPRNGTHPSCDVYTYDLRYNNASASAGAKIYLADESAGTQRSYISLDADWDKHAYYYDYTAGTYESILLKGEEFGQLDGEWYPVLMKPGQSRLQSDQQRVMTQLKGIFYLPAQNTLNAGAEYRYDYLRAPERTENGSADDWTAAVYIQDEFDRLEWLNLTAGLRLVENVNFGVRLTPKASAMFSAGDFRFRLGWSQGFKTPTVKELHYRYLHVMGSTSFFNIGNTSLNPQTSNYYSANIEYRGRRFTASVTGYLNKLDNMIALVNVPVGEIPAGITSAYLGDGSGAVQARMYKNMDDARTCGLDVTLSYKVTKELTLSSAYSYLDTEANLYDVSKDKMTAVTIDGTAHHKWSASATYNHSFGKLYKLGVGLSTRGSSTRYYQNNGNGKPFQIWRINTTHNFGRAGKPLAYRLEVGVDNIFNYVDRTMHPYHLGTNTSGTTVHGTFSITFNYGKRLQKHKTSTKVKTNYEES
ncbi:MAG: TonB-dependent receptor [Bacteroidaceae bacterium]|nr:TonB-dependent receptor [Bacteroidaceae bacterium]